MPDLLGFYFLASMVAVSVAVILVVGTDAPGHAIAAAIVTSAVLSPLALLFYLVLLVKAIVPGYKFWFRRIWPAKPAKVSMPTARVHKDRP